MGSSVKKPRGFLYGMGRRVRKKSGSEWQGRVVGFYSTEFTPEGYAIESEAHRHSVQIYPVGALEVVPDEDF
jgi:dihydrofolate reductase (trimethoprim resistance protein)